MLGNTLRYALFDLDNTLYPKSCGLMPEIGRRINLYMTERLGIEEREVSQRRDAFLKKWGTTLNALRRHYSVDPDEYLNFVHDIPLDGYVRENAKLVRMLKRTALRKVIFTNADAGHARRVLSRAGILYHFESIIDIHALDFINKPDRRAYLRALDFIDACPEECVLIEDSPVNIKPARELGMITVLVGSDTTNTGAHHHIQNITDFEGLNFSTHL
ncbi:MAG: pyrimidine 5'-nucleotidase [Acidobacteriota bacterium]|jgi:putative hydrolase of the HAD superfamily